MKIRQILRNAATNYGRTAALFLIALLMTPLIIHKLGSESYGLWVLMQSIAGYFGLADLGITTSAARYIAHYRALEDWESLNRTISTTLCCYVGAGAFGMIGSVMLAFAAPHLFRLSPEQTQTLRILILLVGAILVVGFVSTLSIQCVLAAQRLDVLNLQQLTVQLIATALGVIGLYMGYGVILLAVLQLLSTVLNGLGAYWLCRRFLPQARFRLHWYPSEAALVVSFAAFSVLITLGERIIYSTDSLVIASCLSVAAVTGYGVAQKISEFQGSMVAAGVTVLGTFAAEQAALGKNESLAQMWMAGTKWSLSITLPITTGLILLGPEIIHAWIGRNYAGAGLAIAWLAAGQVFDLAQISAFQVLMNSGRHKPIAAVILSEALINLSLSLWLVRIYGIVGVAMGTTIPILLRSMVFYPLYMRHVTRCSLRDYLSRAIIPPTLASVPVMLLIIAYAMIPTLPHGSIGLVGLAVLSLVLMCFFNYQFCLTADAKTKTKAHLFQMFRSRFR
ncbi:MAG: oligosaccharide flippase family protein [Armatimonadota bacterium]|nr:oligosaccharide flippase family protein [Armatimonadota bacterium]